MVLSLSKAEVIFAVGHGLDNWVDPLAKSNNTPIIITDRNITLQPIHPSFADDADQQGNDPHYWLTFKNGEAIANQISADLSKKYPEDAASFETNLKKYIAELENHETALQKKFSSLPRKNIATFHDAFGYFAKQYGLNIAAAFEEFPGKEPTPQYVATFTQKVKQAQIAVIFTEPQSSDAALLPIAKDLGLKLSVLDDMGGTNDQTNSYIKMIEYNASQIENALQQAAK